MSPTVKPASSTARTTARNAPTALASMSSADFGNAACARQNRPARHRETHVTSPSLKVVERTAIREVVTSPSHGSPPSTRPPGPSPSSSTGWTSTLASFGSPGTVTWVTRGSHDHRLGSLEPNPLPSPATAMDDRESAPLRWTPDGPRWTPACAALGPPGTSTASCQPSPRITSAKASSDAIRMSPSP